MHGHHLSKKEQEKLANALQHRALQVCPDASLAVPVTAVLWMGAADDTVSEHQQVESHRQSAFRSPLFACAAGSVTWLTIIPLRVHIGLLQEGIYNFASVFSCHACSS